jgi:hypothetical protein
LGSFAEALWIISIGAPYDVDPSRCDPQSVGALFEAILSSRPRRFRVSSAAPIPGAWRRSPAAFLHRLATKPSGRVEPLVLPARSPNLNAYAERWVRSVKEECLSKVVLFGKRSLRRALSEYVEHFHAERNHQGKGNALLFPGVRTSAATGLFNAASDWADSCVITIRRQRASDEFFDLTGSARA